MPRRFPIRPNEHQMEDASFDFFKRLLPAGWTCDQPQHDYGIDIRVGIADHEMLNGQQLVVQLKASKLASSGEFEPVVLSVKTLNYLRSMLDVALIVKYVVAEEEAYWLLLKDYATEPPEGQKTVTIRIPKTNRLSEDPWRSIGEHVEDVHNRKLSANAH